MRRWALSTFYNEVDVLDIRLATLGPLCDVFVFAEATVDQRGNEKPLILRDTLATERFARYQHLDIRVVEVDDMPAGPDAHWGRENFQRNALARGMDGFAQTDAVFVCDLDEIPYPHELAAAFDRVGNGEGPSRFPMDMHVYRLNWRWTERPTQDGSTAVVQPGSACWDDHGQPRPIHDVLLRVDSPWLTHPSGVHRSCGWHLAYMGSAERIAQKMRAIADDGYAQLVPPAKKALRSRAEWVTVEWAAHCALTGDDVWGRDDRKAEWVGVDQLPPTVAEDPERFSGLLTARPADPLPDVWGGPLRPA